MSLENDFENAMMNIYHQARDETGYVASQYFQMLCRHKGLGTAQRLLASPIPSDGYTRLWELKRLDLSVEAVIHDEPKWHPLFTSNELSIATKRLKDYGYI